MYSNLQAYRYRAQRHLPVRYLPSVSDLPNWTEETILPAKYMLLFRLEDVAALGIVTPKSKSSRSPKKGLLGDGHHPLPILFRGLMNFSPQCPWDKVQKIASLVEIQKECFFLHAHAQYRYL